MSPSLFLSQSRPSLFYPPCDTGSLGCFPHRWFGLAISSLACKDLAADQSPNSRAYKAHKYTSQLKQHIAQHSNYAHAHFCSLHIHTGEKKRPAGPKYFCWAQLGLALMQYHARGVPRPYSQTPTNLARIAASTVAFSPSLGLWRLSLWPPCPSPMSFWLSLGPQTTSASWPASVHEFPCLDLVGYIFKFFLTFPGQFPWFVLSQSACSAGYKRLQVDICLQNLSFSFQVFVSFIPSMFTC